MFQSNLSGNENIQIENYPKLTQDEFEKIIKL